MVTTGQPAGQFSTGIWCPHYRGRSRVGGVGQRGEQGFLAVLVVRMV